MARSEVRLQWDPDHDPTEAAGAACHPTGLRGSLLDAFGKRELLEVIDMTEFVAEQRAALLSAGPSTLRTPVEHVYHPADPAVAGQLKLG